MRKTKVWRGSEGVWRVQLSVDQQWHGLCVAPTYAEAILIAQLLVDPHKYARVALGGGDDA